MPSSLLLADFSLFTHQHDQWTTCNFLFFISVATNNNKKKPTQQGHICAFFSLSIIVCNNNSHWSTILKRLLLWDVTKLEPGSRKTSCITWRLVKINYLIRTNFREALISRFSRFVKNREIKDSLKLGYAKIKHAKFNTLL